MLQQHVPKTAFALLLGLTTLTSTAIRSLPAQAQSPLQNSAGTVRTVNAEEITIDFGSVSLSQLRSRNPAPRLIKLQDFTLLAGTQTYSLSLPLDFAPFGVIKGSLKPETTFPQPLAQNQNHRIMFASFVNANTQPGNYSKVAAIIADGKVSKRLTLKVHLLP
jgi:hypothetical protein